MPTDPFRSFIHLSFSFSLFPLLAPWSHRNHRILSSPLRHDVILCILAFYYYSLHPELPRP
jgi:hypothetical protein